MATKCRCDSKPCAGGCPCSKAGSMCGDACHMGKPWESVPCLNTEHGMKVKPLKPAEVRMALCDAGLSPIGDKNELLKRLAVYYSTLTGKGGGDKEDGEEEDGGGGGKDNTTEELMNVILANEGDYVFILSLSGKMVKVSSSKAELRKSYLLLSAKVHPDKNPGSQVSKKAFQAVLESFERLANPEKFEEEEEDDDGKPAKKRQKTERFTRGNSGCFPTKIKCPRCRDRWNTNDLGLEEASYNFLMQGIKQFICGGCFAKFGCMTALHLCPHCNKSFEYDPDDYHRKITCGNKKCDKEFGFMMFKVSERRETEIRKEVKEENEALAKKRAQMKRRADRADKRVGTVSNEDRVQEQLFLLKLQDNCPRCGWELERGLKVEDAKEHLDNCNNEKEIAAYKKKVAGMKVAIDKKDKQAELQEDVQAFKTWEHNGRQVGQLWMLSESTLKKECKKFSLSTDGNKIELITRLGRVIRDRERKMLTMGPEHEKMVTHDVTPIHKVDEEDLPTNLETMEREELACVAASYGIDFDHGKDVKSDLVKKLERARNTGRGLLMITDDRDGDEGGEDSDDDPDFNAESD
eukprot:GFUD01038909.1.p1 GENE.GFUD01038909.1~~GFUD01038909.1.p1  ORF type:complete len:594 (+),score=205.46 GFUD01038909.1:50-1783(+)